MFSRGKTLFVIILLTSSFFFSGFSIPATNSGCDEIELRAITKMDDSNLSPGEVIIEVKNAEQPVTYLFYNEKQKSVCDDININHVKGLKKGTYFSTIIDKKGCMKTVKFKI